MAEPFDSRGDLGSRSLAALIESTSTPGQAGQVVLNPDGSDISGGGGGGGAQFNQTEVHAAADDGNIAMAVRNDAGTALSADGNYAPIQVDATGAVRVTGGGGGTQYAEDSAHVTGDIGTQALAVRNDVAGSLVGANGDYASLQLSATGQLRTQVDSGTVTSNIGTTGGLALNSTLVDGTQNTKITDGTDTAQVTAAGEMNVFSTAQPGVDIGDVTVNNAAGASAVNIQDGGNSLTVDGTVDVGSITTNIVPGVAATSLGKAEDAAHTSGDTGVMSLVVRNDVAGSLVGTNGDYSPLQVDSTGNLRVVASGVTVTQYNEDTPHVSGDAGLQILSKRTDVAAASSGTDGDYSTVNTDSLGHLWSREGYAPTYEDNSNGVAATAWLPLAVSTYTPSVFQDNSFATINVKVTTGNVFSLTCINTTASTRYIQLHNTATTPGGGATARFKFFVPASGTVIVGTDFFTQSGGNFSTGIAVANSSTATTYTAATAGDLLVDILYK